MASDGGLAYPGVAFKDSGGYSNGMSVRDAFAVAITKNSYLTQECALGTVDWIYDFAQVLTDEKLRRDKADRDEGKAR